MEEISRLALHLELASPSKGQKRRGASDMFNWPDFVVVIGLIFLVIVIVDLICRK